MEEFFESAPLVIALLPVYCNGHVPIGGGFPVALHGRGQIVAYVAGVPPEATLNTLPLRIYLGVQKVDSRFQTLDLMLCGVRVGSQGNDTARTLQGVVIEAALGVWVQSQLEKIGPTATLDDT